MEEDEIQAQACKFPRVGNGRNDSNKIGPRGSTEQYPDDERDGGELRRRGGGGGSDGSTNRFHGWHQHSSRIIRVSRASGGKDRHSKVMTSKGLRDRRVRLSVTTAIQFYDLQDRLGCDQPSKAVEWLIRAASDAISELPSLNSTFPDTPKQPSDEKRPSLGTEQGFDSADAELDGETNHQQNQSQNLSLSKSACSSTSETSKGSGLSLSRSEVRVNRFKARERARERTAKDKEKESESRNIAHHQHHQNVNPMSQTASFTELLTGGIGGAGTVNPTATSPGGSVHNQNHHGGGDETNVFNKASRQQWSSTIAPMDYFTSGLLQGPSSSSSSSRIHHLGNSLAHHHHHQAMSTVSPFNIVTGESHSPSSDQLQQHYSFIPDHLIPSAVVTSSQQPSPSGGDYNLNFTISSGLAGYNRGTLQSNSPSLLPHHHHHYHHHLQRFSVSHIDGSNNNVNVPFFIGAAPASSSVSASASASASAAPTMENNHNHYQFSPVFDGRGLQLCYGDGSSRHSDQKGKGKN